MIQTIIVTVILAATLFLTVRWIVRTSRGKGGCSCGCNACPYGGKECHCDDNNPQLPEIKLDK